MSILKALNTSIGKKLVMGFTGLFLVSFLVIHVSVNSMIFLNDNGEQFNAAAHFMSHNYIVRILEIGLLLGLIIHIVQGYKLTLQNRRARKSSYSINPGNATSKWYSRSMAVLGSIVLLFLVVHFSHFWAGTKYNLYFNGDPEMDTYHEIVHCFSKWYNVVLYILGVVGLGWHLVHGIPSAMHTLGINNPTINPIIKTGGLIFTIIVCLLFCLMPIAVAVGYLQ